ncbi:hypothetical protein R1flu_018019 [Riccia fluitans]|uniref:Glutathione S-transferase n=1 Tax=Riccia fluitans TaxID=41844 RepID=A0ABD1ZEM1_9MARC
MLTLYGDLLSQPTRAVALFCLANNIEYQLHFIDLSKQEHKRPEFLAINPRGLLPAITDDGFNLGESATILRYLAVTRSVPDHWYPADAKTRARIDSLLDWHHANLRQTSRYVFTKELQETVFKLPPPKKDEFRLYEWNMLAAMDVLEKEFLIEGPFLLGGSEPSIADLLLACEVTQTQILKKPDLEVILGPRPKIRLWLKALESNLAPNFSTVHSRIRDAAAFLEKKRNSELGCCRLLLRQKRQSTPRGVEQAMCEG